MVSKTQRKRKASVSVSPSEAISPSEASDVSSNCNTDDFRSVEFDKEEIVDALDFLDNLSGDDTDSLHLPLPSCECVKNECAMHLVNQSLLSVKSSLARIEALLTNRTQSV